MLGGHKRNVLIKIGNPFYKNHFFKSSISEKYKHIVIDYNQALREGRYTQEFIDEVKENMTGQEFAILYECKFPDDSLIDPSGYYRLLSDEKILNAKEIVDHNGDLRIGFDIGEGGDENVGILRSNKYAEIIHVSKISDLMATTKIIKDLIEKHKVKSYNCFIDATGIGAGVVARLKEIGVGVTGIKWAEKASSDNYANLKAENYIRLEEWMRNDGKLQPTDDWNELMVIKWKKDTQDRIKIKTKEELRKEGVKSPNIADAFALTFNKSIEEDAPNIYII